VLDEIDAPLDDVNVYRFNQLVKEIGQQSQVVMITHDRQTMEVANALFGVTMEQKGISKLISLDMSTS
jgi:chromosome segregation protein